MFHVHLENAVPPLASVVVTLSYQDQHGHTGPATVTTVFMGDGSGGSVETGNPEEVSPTEPTITLTFAPGSLTGDEKGKLDDQEVHFTKRGKDSGEAIIVQVSSGTSLGTIESIEISCSDGQVESISGSSGTASFVLLEGRYELTAMATAKLGTRVAYGYLQKPLVLIVDRTPPAFTFTSKNVFWESPTIPDYIVPSKPLSYWWNDATFYLNSNSEGGATGNKELRRTKSWGYYNRDAFSMTVTVNDLTGGLRSNSEKTTYVGSTATELSATQVMGSDREITRLEIGGFSIVDSLPLQNRTIFTDNLEDRAGNKVSNYGNLTFCCVVNPQVDAIGNTVAQSAIWSPVRHYKESGFGAGGANAWPEKWQGSDTSESNRMFRGYSRYIGDDAWILRRPADISGLGLNETVSESITSRDLCGNLLTINTKWTGIRTYHAAYVFQSYYSGSGHYVPIDDTGSADSVPTVLRYGFDAANGNLDEGNYIFPSFTGPSGHYWFQTTQVFGVNGSVELAEKGRLTGLWPVPNWESDNVSTIWANQMVPTAPIHPGKDDISRHVRPAIMTAPPSWEESPATVRVIVKDAALDQHDVIDELSTPLGGKSFYSDSDGVVQKLAPDVAAVDFTPVRPGISESIFLLGAGDVSYRTSSSGYAASYGYSNHGARWMNILMLDQDIVATGSSVTVRIIGNFLDGSFGPGQFSPVGDYVRFTMDGQDITISSADIPTTQNPEELDNAIAITAQRFVAHGWGQAYVQMLELDVAVGSKVKAGLCSVDIKLGDVHFKGATPGFEQATENNPDPGKGENGAYRMKNAMKIIGIEYLTLEDPANSQSPAEMTQRINASVPRPIIKLAEDSSVKMAGFDSNGRQLATITLSGSIKDCIADTMPRGTSADIGLVTIYWDEKEIAVVEVEPSDDGGVSFFRPHPYKGTFSIENIEVIVDGDTHYLRAETSKNAAGQVGSDQMIVSFAAKTIPGVPNDGSGAGIFTAAFPANPTDATLDQVIVFSGVREVLPDDPLLVERDGEPESWVFVNATDKIIISFENKDKLPFTEAVDVFTGIITYTWLDGFTVKLAGEFVETTAISRNFRALIQNPGGAVERDPQVHWTASTQHLEGTDAGFWNPLTVRIKGELEGLEDWKFSLNGAVEFKLEADPEVQEAYLLKGGSTNVITIVPLDGQLALENPEAIQVEIITYDPVNHAAITKRVGLFNSVTGRLFNDKNQSVHNLAGYYHISSHANDWPKGTSPNVGANAGGAARGAAAVTGKLLLSARQQMRAYAANKTGVNVPQTISNLIKSPGDYGVAWKYRDLPDGFKNQINTDNEETPSLVYYDAPEQNELGKLTAGVPFVKRPLDAPSGEDKEEWKSPWQKSRKNLDFVTAELSWLKIPGKPKDIAMKPLNLTMPYYFQMKNVGMIKAPPDNFGRYLDQQNLPPDSGTGGVIWRYTTGPITSNAPLSDDSQGQWLLRCTQRLSQNDPLPKPGIPPAFLVTDQFKEKITESDPGDKQGTSLRSQDSAKNVHRDIQMRETIDWTGTRGLIKEFDKNVAMLRVFGDADHFTLGMQKGDLSDSNSKWDIASSISDNLEIKLNVSAWLRAKSTELNGKLVRPKQFNPDETKFRNIVFNAGPVLELTNGVPTNNQVVIRFYHYWIIRVGDYDKNAKFHAADMLGEENPGRVFAANVFEARLRDYQEFDSYDQFALECTYTVNLLQRGGVPWAERPKPPAVP